jgi:hypothetical protein
MDWIIQSKDELIGRVGENHHITEPGFLALLRGVLRDPQKQFISATLSDGTALDEATTKKLAGIVTVGGSGVGEAQT